jgi:hypothetical protein
MKLHPNQDSKDIISRSFHINISVCSVDQEMIHQLTTTIERVLRKTSVTVVIAQNVTYTTRLDLICAIIYPEPKKLKNVVDNIRKTQIASCFPEGMKFCGKKRSLLVTASPIEPFDDTGFWKMHSVWSQSPWAMIYAGPGAAAARREGSQFPLMFPKFSVSKDRNLNRLLQRLDVA